MIREINACRACGHRDLRPLVGFGEIHLPGFLVSEPAQRAPLVPLELVRCDDATSRDACGLVQLRHVMDLPELRATSYADHAAAHPATRRHLAGIAERLRRHVRLTHQDVVIDIGSSDGTLLSCFEAGGPILVGIDPTAGRYRRQYRVDVEMIPQAFSPDLLGKRFSGKKVKVVTAIAVLHELDDPLSFLRGIRQVLDHEGVACLEQVYLPPIVKHRAHDAIRPEHVAYYTVRQALWLAERAGLKVLDVVTNDSEGGSFAVTMARGTSPKGRPPSSLGWYAENEDSLRLGDPATWTAFEQRIAEQKRRLLELLDRIREAGETIVGWGVSAAGNALLERYGIGPDRLPAVASADADAVGRFTPGTGIPVISEADARARAPQYLLSLSWHFRDDVRRGLEDYLLGGGRLIFPLPEVEIVSA